MLGPPKTPVKSKNALKAIGYGSSFPTTTISYSSSWKSILHPYLVLLLLEETLHHVSFENTALTGFEVVHRSSSSVYRRG